MNTRYIIKATYIHGPEVGKSYFITKYGNRFFSGKDKLLNDESFDSFKKAEKDCAKRSYEIFKRYMQERQNHMEEILRGDKVDFSYYNILFTPVEVDMDTNTIVEN